MMSVQMRRWGRCLLVLLCCGLVLLQVVPTQAQETTSDPREGVRFDQRLDQPLPLDLSFTDESDQPVQLSQFFSQKPVILVLGYYECTLLCPVVRDGLLTSLQNLDFDIGKDFTVVNVSINPRETSSTAAAQKAVYVQRYGRPGAAQGWHFLTGNEAAIKSLADAVGFYYRYDEASAQYVHPSGIVLATPKGRIARYLYGVDYAPRDLRLGLVEASENKIGTPVDQLLLLCYHYDPQTGKYTGLALGVTRLAALGTILGLGVGLVVLSRRYRHDRLVAAPPADQAG